MLCKFVCHSLKKRSGKTERNTVSRWNILSRFSDDRNAVASIEFAFITPIMVFFMLGAVAAFDVVQGAKSYSNAAKTIVDLVTRQTTFSNTDMTMQVAIAKALMDEYADVPDLEIRITSLYNDEDDLDGDLEEVEIGWSVSNITGRAMDESEISTFGTLPTIPRDETIILVEVSGTYTPYITTDFIGAVDFYRYAIRRPRFSASVKYVP